MNVRRAFQIPLIVLYILHFRLSYHLAELPGHTEFHSCPPQLSSMIQLIMSQGANLLMHNHCLSFVYSWYPFYLHCMWVIIDLLVPITSCFETGDILPWVLLIFFMGPQVTLLPLKCSIGSLFGMISNCSVGSSSFRYSFRLIHFLFPALLLTST